MTPMKTPHTILLVEDEEDLREMMREVLVQGGYHVLAASDGQQALDALAGVDRVCVVILDLLMPRMNGWDFVEALRREPGNAQIPIVVHTSAPNQAPAGVTRVLRKPITMDGLLSVVRDYCSG